MNRKGFVAAVAALAAAPLTAKASGDAAAVQPIPAKGDPYTETVLALQTRIDEQTVALNDLIGVVNALSAQLADYRSSVGTLVHDNDDVDQAQSASNRQQIVSAGGTVIADGQFIRQCQIGG